MAVSQFEKDLHKYQDDIAKRARRGGPVFSMSGEQLVWGDQVFEREIEPVGTVNCSQALRVGSTLGRLDVALVASNANADDLLIPAGSTITASFMQSDREDGTFEEVGPTICIKAPASGKEVGPNGIVARFPACDFSKPWLMVNLEFSGAITGGTVDCVLDYIAG